MLPSKHEIDCVRAYFRLIGLIMRYKRWMKPAIRWRHISGARWSCFVAVELAIRSMRFSSDDAAQQVV